MKWIDKILSYSFNYLHLLCCFNNETGKYAEWVEYWVQSQNNGTSRSGQEHYDPVIKLRDYIYSNPRPMNNVKVYGGEGGWGGIEEGVRKFWRNIFAGSASTRFHRRFPAAGLGLNELASVHIRASRDFTDKLNLFVCTPHNDLLSDRLPDEAYCLTLPGERYAVYFPDSG